MVARRSNRSRRFLRPWHLLDCRGNRAVPTHCNFLADCDRACAGSTKDDRPTFCKEAKESSRRNATRKNRLHAIARCMMAVTLEVRLFKVKRLVTEPRSLPIIHPWRPNTIRLPLRFEFASICKKRCRFIFWQRTGRRVNVQRDRRERFDRNVHRHLLR